MLQFKMMVFSLKKKETYAEGNAEVAEEIAVAI